MNNTYLNSERSIALSLQPSKGIQSLLMVLFVYLTSLVSFGQSCNVVSNGTFTGNAIGWTLQGTTATGWYYESTWAPNEIYIEADGVTNVALKQSLTGLITGPLVVSFRIKGQNANRLSICPTTASLVVKIGGTTYMTINNPASNTQITTANVSTSNGASYTQTGFPLTVGGATSAISVTQGTITLSIPWSPATAAATLADIEFVATTSNTASGSCAAWGGDDWFLDNISVIASDPTAYNMTGSSVCVGASTTIGLADSQLGVNYQLQLNGVNSGAVVAGTGVAISFGSKSATGVYTVVATAGSTTCTEPMNGSVSINPNPTLTGAAQSATVCAGSGALINLTGLLASSTSTINYTINGVAQTAITGVVANGAGAASFTSAALTAANNGQQLRVTGVITTSASTNCSTTFTQNVTLSVIQVPAGLSYTVASPVYCRSTAITTNSATLATGTGITYTVSPALPAGLAISSTTGAITGTPTTAVAATNYTVTATNTCGNTTAVINITVSGTLTITTAATPAVVTAVCQSASAQTTTMAYTATTGTPTSYSINWATLTDQASTAFAFTAGAGSVTGITVPAGTAAGTYTGTMTISNGGCTVTKTLTLTIDSLLVANAGTDSCSAPNGSFTMPAGTPAGGTWSLVSGSSGISINLAGDVSGMGNGKNGTFRYTVTNSCGTDSDDVYYARGTNTVGTPTVIAVIGTEPSCQLTNGTTTTTYSTTATNSSSFTWSLSNPSAGSIDSSGVMTWANGFSGSVNIQVVANGCGSSSSQRTRTVTISAAPAITVQPSTPAATCSGSGTQTMTVTATGAGLTYDWKLAGVSVVNGGVISGQGTVTLTLTNPTATNAGSYTVVVSGTCAPAVTSTARTVTVNTVPTTPTVGTITQPTCISSTGSVVLSGLPASGTINQTGTAASSYSITGTTMTISGLAVGTYNFTVSNGTCSSLATGNVVLTSVITKTWNGSWSPSGAPTSSNIVIINANYSASTNGDLNACSLTINTGFKLTIEAGKFVIIQNNLTVNGTLDVLDKGSLVMVNDAGVVTNTGTTNIRRFTTAFKLYDYTYWSTPVVSTTIATTFPTWNTSHAYEYLPANFFDGNADNIDDDNNDWSFVSAMTPAKGYIIMVPTPTTGPGTNNPFEVVFNGRVNNGVQKVTGVITGGTYLVGNPYPSALDADAFINANAGVIDGTLYFWTHNTAIQLASGIGAGKAGSGRYAYTSDDYASYNLVGGVGVATQAISGGTIPTGKIASCQSFFTTTNASIVGTNEIVFNNSMRLGSGGTTLSNAQFFKTKKPKGTIEKNRIWLNLSNDEGAFKQTLLGYVTGATNANEGLYDGESFDGNEFIDFYSVNQDKNLVIQGRALPFDENDEVPLGYTTTIDGTFSIDIEQVDGLLTSQNVFIEDKLTNTEFNLKSGKYTFNTEIGTFNDRFVLKYKSSNETLGTGDIDAQTNKVLVSVKNKQVKINSFAETIDNVVIYDVLGRLIYQKDNVNSNELSIADLAISNQALIVKTTLQNGIISTDKIIY